MTQRTALITGGMGGLGETISTKMHDAGYRVVVTRSPGNSNAENWLAEMKLSLIHILTLDRKSVV